MTRTISEAILTSEDSNDESTRRVAAGSVVSRPSTQAGPDRWAVVDADGKVLATDLDSRSVAIRMLGALSDGRLLPLFVVDGSGKRTGDRLG